jgi:hypothetical protein
MKKLDIVETILIIDIITLAVVIVVLGIEYLTR